MRTILLTLLVACGSSPSMSGDNPVDAHGSGTPPADGTTVPPDGSVVAGALTVFTIVLENHDYKEIIGSSNAPYVNSLLSQGALATAYKDTNHPSLPNYLHLISGADQYPGFVDIGPTQAPYFPADKPNLGTQLEAAGVPWRSYQESMPAPCTLTSSGNYAPKHDPFLYFKDQQTGPNSLCATNNVPYSQFAADLAGGTYRYMWITPDLVNDGHDPTSNPVAALTASDTWLSVNVPKILASDAYQAGGVLFIVWDEAEGRAGDDPDLIPMIVLAKHLPHPHTTNATPFTHASYLATVEDLLHLPRLATVTSTPTLMPLMQ